VNVRALERLNPNQSVLHVQLRMYGSVVLALNNQPSEAITWESERLMVVQTSDLDARVQENVNFLVDDFSKAYRAANPR
jgi:hypothetical protein